MAGKVVSIKIGYTITHVAEVDHEAKNPKIYHAFSFETPDDVIDDEGVHVTDDFVQKFKKGMVDAGIAENKQAVFTISSTRVANREVTIPQVKENKIRSILIANAKDYFPVDLSNYQLVYRVIEHIKDQKQMRVSVFAVPNALINSYQYMAKALGMQLVAMDYYGNSIYEAMMYSMSNELSATLCIDDNTSMLTVIQNSQVILQRSIGYGIDEAVYAMMQSSLVPRGCGYEKALTQMQMNPCFAEQLRPRSEMNEEVSKSTKENITQSLTLLISNISRVLDYFASRHSEVNLESLTLVGMGASCKGIEVLLTNELGIPVRPVVSFGSFDVTRALSAQRFNLGEYYINIASAMKPLNFILEQDEKKKKEKESLVLPLIVFTGCVLISLALVGVMVAGNFSINNDNKRLKSLIESKRDVINDYNKYVESRVINEGITTIESTSNVPNDAFLDFLEEMETNMPSDILITSLSVSDSTISLSATFGSKENAAAALIELRSFSTVYDVECEGITEQEDENGDTKVFMDVTLTYVPQLVQSANTDGDAAEAETQQSDTQQSDTQSAN